MTYTTEQIRSITARDYARRARAGDDVCGLFECAIDEGWRHGIAAAVELVMEGGDMLTVEALRRLAASALAKYQGGRPPQSWPMWAIVEDGQLGYLTEERAYAEQMAAPLDGAEVVPVLVTRQMPEGR